MKQPKKMSAKGLVPCPLCSYRAGYPYQLALHYKVRHVGAPQLDSKALLRVPRAGGSCEHSTVVRNPSLFSNPTTATPDAISSTSFSVSDPLLSSSSGQRPTSASFPRLSGPASSTSPYIHFYLPVSPAGSPAPLDFPRVDASFPGALGVRHHPPPFL